MRALVVSSRSVRRANAVNAADSPPMSRSETRVLSTAVDVRADGPCVR
jgi:hypothetical protein